MLIALGALVALFVVLPFLTLSGYLVVSAVKRGLADAEAAGESVWWAWKAVAWICGVVAYPGDLWWNLTFGSFIYREWPQWIRGEITFTSRTKRHYHESAGAQRYLAEIWFKRLNRMWPGHIKDRRK